MRVQKCFAGFLVAVCFGFVLPTGAIAKYISLHECAASVSRDGDTWMNERYLWLGQGEGLRKGDLTGDPTLSLRAFPHDPRKNSICANCGSTEEAVAPGSWKWAYEPAYPDETGSSSGISSAKVKIFMGKKTITLGPAKPKFVPENAYYKAINQKPWGSMLSVAMALGDEGKVPTDWSLDLSYKKYLKKIKKFQGKKRRVRVQLLLQRPSYNYTSYDWEYNDEGEGKHLEDSWLTNVGPLNCAGPKSSTRLPVKFR
ncbi:MAG: hypothetical protein IPK93_11075 [Solirubrobacterales bacterium]|nr:hypothetical protein [Solirubrobacterales bacterium]